ncbi:desert hedgehog protein [Trichuris trichiura]|uniref:Hedgehog protein n=1 Tax=Trichuris trichiura TaxID=36087 RepID=A0A077ZAM7_TRITR|nr:desert hedgehog protein [Trichuris trichiura]
MLFTTSKSLSVRSTTLATISLLVVVAIVVNLCKGCHPSYNFGFRSTIERNQPMIYKERYPNVQETHPLASGPAELRIRRNDVRFKRLVNNTNRNIVFKDEEGTGADRIMTNRCRYKLNLLALLVSNFWPGVKLRVIDAWEERNRQVVGSLHYEGRAVDITTSDRDNRKIPRLARLAVQAGFDWVYFESRQHVHASVKSDNGQKRFRQLHCFPGDAFVAMADGSYRKLSQLKPGDLVIVPAGNNGLTTANMITFLHTSPDERGSFLAIRLADNSELIVSPDHLVYRSAESTYMETVFASEIRIGDQMFTMSNKSDGSQFRPVAVIRVENSTAATGYYAPLTTTGTIFINNVLVSNYAGISNHWLAHQIMAPLRLLFQIPFFGHNVFKEMPTEGIHWYAEYLLYFVNYANSLGLWSPMDYR